MLPLIDQRSASLDHQQLAVPAATLEYRIRHGSRFDCIRMTWPTHLSWRCMIKCSMQWTLALRRISTCGTLFHQWRPRIFCTDLIVVFQGSEVASIQCPSFTAKKKNGNTHGVVDCHFGRNAQKYTVGEPTKGGGCELDLPIDLMRDIAVTC